MLQRAKIQAAIHELKARGVHPGLIHPPLIRGLWRLGLKVPPPIFLPFDTLAVGTTVMFTIGMAPAYWFFPRPEWSFVEYMGAYVAPGGLLLGLCMAGCIRWKAWRLGLPRWKEFGED